MCASARAQTCYELGTEHYGSRPPCCHLCAIDTILTLGRIAQKCAALPVDCGVAPHRWTPRDGARRGRRG